MTGWIADGLSTVVAETSTLLAYSSAAGARRQVIG